MSFRIEERPNPNLRSRIPLKTAAERRREIEKMEGVHQFCGHPDCTDCFPPIPVVDVAKLKAELAAANARIDELNAALEPYRGGACPACEDRRRRNRARMRRRKEKIACLKDKGKVNG